MPEEREPTDEELEKRVKHLLGEEDAAASEGVETDPLEARMAEIEERARKIRANNPMPEPPEWDFKRPEPSKPSTMGDVSYRDLGFGLTVLYSLVGPLAAGFAIGYLIDRRTSGSNLGQLMGTVIGAACGLVACFVTISRHERKP
jgi:hypothetical protein